MKYRKLASLQFLYEISEDGELRNVKSKKVRVPYNSKNGYLTVTISIKGKYTHRTIHSMVAEAWLGPRPDGYVIDHIDRNKHNNHYSNLRYVTPKENVKNVSEEEKLRRSEYAKNFNLDHLTDRGYYTYVNGVKFRSLRAASRFIAEETNTKYTTVYGRLAHRDTYVLGYNISYTS